MGEPWLGDRIGMAVMEPGSLVMERKMLCGIKQRAERLASEPAAVGPTRTSLRAPDGVGAVQGEGVRLKSDTARGRTSLSCVRSYGAAVAAAIADAFRDLPPP